MMKKVKMCDRKKTHDIVCHDYDRWVYLYSTCLTNLNKFLYFIYIYIHMGLELSKLTVIKDDAKVLFSIATTPRCTESKTLFSGLLHFFLNLIMLSVKQGSIKYHLLSLWCDSTWD